MEIDFARRISLRPLFDSLVSGLVVGDFCLIAFSSRIYLGILLGISAFLIESLLIYPSNLAMLYGYWQMDPSGIYCYDYSTFLDKLHAIFLPSFEKQHQIKFEQIKSIAVYSPNEISYLLKEPPTWIRRPYYLELTLKDGQRIRLDLSWNLHGGPTSESEIQKAVRYIKFRTNKKSHSQ